MIYVFDASFIAAVIIPDEANPHTQKMFSKIKNEDERHVPHLLWYEITNIYRNLIRHKRYAYNDVINFISLLTPFRLITDTEGGINYSIKLLRFSNDYGLSSYDATYLELAERKKAVLCTLDHHLQIAAKKHGVKVLGA
jgi:predicted nucleic acid-binding protein